jgi:hypothetical protein
MEAEIAIKRDLEMAPEDEEGIGDAAEILLAAGKPQDALDMAQKMAAEQRSEILPLIYDALGRKADADSALNELIKRGDSEAMSLAAVYAHRSENDRAFTWLERAYSSRDADLWFLRSDPAFKSLRGDPRYLALLQKLGLTS